MSATHADAAPDLSKCPSALAAAVARVLRDAALRERLGRNARERQRRTFDIASTVTEFENLYEHLFAASARGRCEARSLVAG